MADGSVHEKWFCVADLAGLPGLPGTERGIHMRAERDAWSRRDRARGKGWEYAFSSLPAATQAAILLRSRPTVERVAPSAPTSDAIVSAWNRFERAKKKLRDVAATRLQAVETVEALCRNGTPLMVAREHVAKRLTGAGGKGCSAPNIARWQKAIAHAAPADYLALLLPHYSGRIDTAEIDPEAWQLFKADYLRLEAPTASSCYERLKRISVGKAWALPSLKTLQRRIKRELPRAVITLARQGDEALMRSFPAQERDRTMFRALDAVNADGHRWDIRVRFPDGTEGRPCILGWQDLYSGKLLAWRLGDHENSDMVRLSFGDMCRGYGVPGGVWLDNGRAFASKWMTGGTPNRYRFKVREDDPTGLITSLVGATNVHWVTPYHGQAKPIERMWRDFCEAIAKHPAFSGAYVGNNPTNKPANYGSRVVDWAEFESVVTSEIHAHNARVGRRTKVCAGRSFDQVFADSFQQITVRRVSEEQLRLLLLATEAVTASSIDGSVRLAGNRYWTEALSEYAGRKVVLRVDPYHLQGSAHVYALDGSYIAEAQCVANVGFADVNAAREHARGRKQYKRAAKDMLAAERLMDAAQVAAQIPSMEPPRSPDAAVIAPVFGLHGKKPVASLEQPAATGTNGPTKLDLLMFEQAKRQRENSF
ncbi:MAG: transposase domain-containing protein [Luteibacter sp.]